ncbi:unnamed protein product [Rangifer tarandus platyrhynchus]|uniref:Uncharacterized protein n=1 Tax=Rangifer tarandus platyrhynchus TaxID=3082113 RepID=A0ABN8ZYH8_RANTA|nr:unnamed protein product [Rangifer tarandus platyrhynchus]
MAAASEEGGGASQVSAACSASSDSRAKRPGAAGPQSREEDLAVPRRAGDQGVGERHLRKVGEAAGWGFPETSEQTLPRPAPLGRSPPDAEATSLQGTAAEAHPPSARSGEPQSGPPAAAGRTRRLRGQVTGRVPARPSLSATWDLTGIAGETCVTWRNGHVPRAGHVQGGRGAEPELARSRETRGGHVTARERCGLT